LEIGKGKEIVQALREIGTVEGYHTAKAVYGLAQKLGLELPIMETVYRVLYEELPPKAAAQILMNREPKEE
jgi:glycerol-3-phosphate dehydrogenase (NAD(P)+)